MDNVSQLLAVGENVPGVGVSTQLEKLIPGMSGDHTFPVSARRNRRDLLGASALIYFCTNNEKDQGRGEDYIESLTLFAEIPPLMGGPFCETGQSSFLPDETDLKWR